MKCTARGGLIASADWNEVAITKKTTPRFIVTFLNICYTKSESVCFGPAKRKGKHWSTHHRKATSLVATHARAWKKYLSEKHCENDKKHELETCFDCRERILRRCRAHTDQTFFVDTSTCVTAARKLHQSRRARTPQMSPRASRGIGC